MKNMVFLLTLILIFLTLGCEAPTAFSDKLPSPEPDKAIVYGQLLSPAKEPLKDMTVRLAQVYRFGDEEGAFILDDAQSPSAISQEDGEYVFLNITSGEYVLFIGKLHADYKIVSETDDIPIVYEVGPGETLKIEPVIVDFD